MNTINCCRCSQPFPELRLLKFGYNYCLKCSTTERVGGVAIANHKTGNEIQILPLEVANMLYRASQRQGYGVSKGIKGIRK